MSDEGLAAPVALEHHVRKLRTRGACFSEGDHWREIGSGWRPLFGHFRELGFSFEWHDFACENPMDWARSFHPESVEICLNLSGTAQVSDGARRVDLGSGMAAFYHHAGKGLSAQRHGVERHRFITVELSHSFLRDHLGGNQDGLHPLVRSVVERKAARPEVSNSLRLSAQHLHLMSSLRHPPVFSQAQPVWFRGKALELIADFFYQSSPGEELFCERQKRLNLERVNRVIAVLKENIAEPPTLEALGRKVGCSHFYLSRIFSQEMGATISQYVRDLRMEKAAELLRSGNYNVTEAAMEVGYSSPSHFSTAFHEAFGCCPGLYPLATPVQMVMRSQRKE